MGDKGSVFDRVIFPATGGGCCLGRYTGTIAVDIGVASVGVASCVTLRLKLGMGISIIDCFPLFGCCVGLLG